MIVDDPPPPFPVLNIQVMHEFQLNPTEHLQNWQEGKVIGSVRHIKYKHICLHTHMHRDTGLNKHFAAPSDHRSAAALLFALSLVQLHSLIIHTLIGRDVDKAFKQLNPCCINMNNMHIVYVLILSLCWRACICCLLHFNRAALSFPEMSLEGGEIDRFDCW